MRLVVPRIRGLARRRHGCWRERTAGLWLVVADGKVWITVLSLSVQPVLPDALCDDGAWGLCTYTFHLLEFDLPIHCLLVKHVVRQATPLAVAYPSVLVSNLLGPQGVGETNNDPWRYNSASVRIGLGYSELTLTLTRTSETRRTYAYAYTKPTCDR
ncbi:uncharacterized protein C8Q71DRAFT_487832 [Rhodofomes roseus]|uniref:Uncharacterized protein n=1 Tax=Rhodofomes roseus TaxID=34475 RepID=A0ABQ8JXQ7_9APHY|nr:uncharacterized protein C8Q71DRAFT_487832 [Rhodofomes roseus]KAH9828639.1 hypothetical protein C8Q71DRAFT_487832 [Rhodofomes roseus]